MASPVALRSPSAYQPLVHWLAVATAAATFPLICLGGEVTSRHAGMSVPDWPTSWGYNMFLFPPSRWIGGIFFEHTHRLWATLVGNLAIALVITAWWPALRRTFLRLVPRPQSTEISPPPREPSGSAAGPEPNERPTQILALAVLAGVLFQGILGGLRVVWKDLDLAIVHACVAQAFFCLAAYAALVTSRWWHTAPTLSNAPDAAAGRRLIRWSMITLLVVYAQLIIGAIMRHEDAGLAIPDLPLAYGKLLPPTTAAGLAAANHARLFVYNLAPVSLAQVWLHFGHRLGALAVTIAICATTWLALRGRKTKTATPLPPIANLAKILAALLVIQLTLGILTVLMRKPFEIASAHVATGALVLLTTFLLTARAYRLYHPRFSPTSAARTTAEREAIETQELAPA